jgi:hypothetical protein
VWCGIGVFAQDRELCVYSGILVFENLGTFYGQGGFQRVSLQFERGCVCFMLVG